MSIKLRKSKRRKLRKKRKIFRVTRNISLFLIFASLIAVISYVAYFSVTTGTFDVSQIEVEGAEILTNEQIIEASGITEGENIFLIDSNTARYNINKVISAKEIIIQKVLPNKIVITLVENQPLGVISYDDKNYYFDSNGHLMEVTDELGKDDTPIVTGFYSYDFPQIGDLIVVDPQYKFDQIIRMLTLFEQNNLLSQLSQVSVTNENTYRIITKNGVVFTVKDFSNLKEYYDYVTSVIENGEINQDINLASGRTPIKKAR